MISGWITRGNGLEMFRFAQHDKESELAASKLAKASPSAGSTPLQIAYLVEQKIHTSPRSRFRTNRHGPASTK